MQKRLSFFNKDKRHNFFYHDSLCNMVFLSFVILLVSISHSLTQERVEITKTIDFTPKNTGVALNITVEIKYWGLLGTPLYTVTAKGEIIGETVYYEGKMYGRAELGEELWGKIKEPSHFEILFDIYNVSGQKVSTVVRSGATFMDVPSNAGLGNYFPGLSEDQEKKLFKNGFTIKNIRIGKDPNFRGLSSLMRSFVRRKEGLDEYNQLMSEGNQLFSSGKLKEARSKYREAVSESYKTDASIRTDLQEKAKDKIRKVDEALKEKNDESNPWEKIMDELSGKNTVAGTKQNEKEKESDFNDFLSGETNRGEQGNSSKDDFSAFLSGEIVATDRADYEIKTRDNKMGVVSSSGRILIPFRSWKIAEYDPLLGFARIKRDEKEVEHVENEDRTRYKVLVYEMDVVNQNGNMIIESEKHAQIMIYPNYLQRYIPGPYLTAGNPSEAERRKFREQRRRESEERNRQIEESNKRRRAWAENTESRLIKKYENKGYIVESTVHNF